ncbi:glutathione S-transferase [Sphingomonas sp. AP4-R1]|uniref:glutathione S-transferase family protein n=1 Tax=Sphingomonas sp. AP4-R1 TaxID=2735134 RepID=UPI001493CA1F|nr:glutathione S-transferase [Sphingomonas sp. AP4-R1]QJU57160.1 glutathione S-transferase [Sphingomonas sp. AP4-R1]
MTDEAGFDFFYDAGSCSLAVRIVLEEVGCAYRAHRVSARAADRDTLGSAWLARNPKGRVPALSPVPGRAGGEPFLLTEVPAILTWLARLRPDLDLMPADPAREARALEWMNWLSGWVHAVAFAQQWRPERFSADAPAHAGIRAKGRGNLLDAFDAIERILVDGRQWAVADAYSVVDAFLLVFYRWGGLVDVEMGRYPAWAELTARTLQRPAVIRAFDKDELSMPV